MRLDNAALNLLAHDLKVDGLAVLAGAGMSLAPPACAPLFRPLRDALVSVLSESLSAVLDPSVIARCQLLFSGSTEVRRGVEPVPEVLFEALHSALHEQLFDALRILLGLSAPNIHHQFIADLTNHGLQLLITTNFEDGFEQAFGATGRPFEVCADGSGISRSFSDLCLHKDRTHFPIWKVHGTLETGAEETIRITLSQVAKERLDPQKYEPIIAIPAQLPLLVVGYSGYDADLSQILIRAAEKGTRLYWLSYREPLPGDPALRILQAWQERGHLLVGDLTDLFRQLAKLVPVTFPQQPPAECNGVLAARFEELKNWAVKIGVNNRLKTLAILCWQLTDYETALAVLDALEKLIIQSKNGEDLLFCLATRSTILRSAGRGREIGNLLFHIKRLRENMGGPEEPEFIDVDILLLHELGSFFRAHGKPDLAEDVYRKALALSHLSKDIESFTAVAQSLGVLLSHYGNTKEAKELFNLALVSAIKSGDRYREIKAKHELGIIAYEEGNYETASRLLEESVGLAHEIGAVDIESSGTLELGILRLRVEENYDRAHTLFSQARALARLIGNKNTELTALIYLADIEQQRGKHSVAIEILTNCAHSAAEICNGSIEATALSRKARSHAFLGEFDQAKADLERARLLAERWFPGLMLEINGVANFLAQP